MKHEKINVSTPGRGFTNITHKVQSVVRQSGVKAGLCHLFIRHTSASLVISENADPDVLVDLEKFMSRLVPDGDGIYVHTAEGPDDMPAHVRNILTQTHLTIPVIDAQCDLGTWQGVFLWEHRHQPHSRTVTVSLST